MAVHPRSTVVTGPPLQEGPLSSGGCRSAAAALMSRRRHLFMFVLEKPNDFFVKDSPQGPPTATNRQLPTAANRHPLFNTVSVVLCLAHVNEAESVPVRVRFFSRYEGFFLLLRTPPPPPGTALCPMRPRNVCCAAVWCADGAVSLGLCRQGATRCSRPIRSWRSSARQALRACSPNCTRRCRCGRA